MKNRSWILAKPSQTERCGHHSVSLPDDLREWITESRLAMVVLDAVSSLPKGALTIKGLKEGETVFTGPAMLTLLTYAYLTGRYGSEQIEGDCLRDRMLGYLGGYQSPSWHVLRRFRRVYRDELHDCLTAALNGVFEYCKGSLQTGELPASGRSGVRPTSQVSEDAHTRECSRVARERIETAVQIDSMAMDL